MRTTVKVAFGIGAAVGFVVGAWFIAEEISRTTVREIKDFDQQARAAFTKYE
jgi:fucose permease